jgi:hypothetical protein
VTQPTRLDLSDEATVRQLWHLQRLAYAVEAELIGYDGIPELEPASRTIVSTGTANTPALTLYRRRGFVPTGNRQIAPGVTVTHFERLHGSRLLR